MARVEQEKVFGDEKESFHAGSIEKGELWVLPTEDEKSGPNRLGRIADKVPWTAYSIGIVEMAERFSYYGSTAVFTNFIQQPLPRGSRTGAGGHDHVSGALGRGIQAAQVSPPSTNSGSTLFLCSALTSRIRNWGVIKLFPGLCSLR
ncbi:uncharacterized protein EI90DRAFT_2634710 [Cantharellus anzutake]|uniref:uncharacterized protein n=1 Tax=Cantharellus anzutake TaxID=1750568 RepID=UPI001902D9AD|nr:uncharacterized protein EI90DRAFT_2634710 [Cantharellus anzutake]KAF8319518.1 hypothetical protein EI90DRAFT_2634710 [Cantharellus anzutake]